MGRGDSAALAAPRLTSCMHATHAVHQRLPEQRMQHGRGACKHAEPPRTGSARCLLTGCVAARRYLPVTTSYSVGC